MEQEEEGAVTEEEELDPVAEARKALEMFEEVSGETMAHIIPKSDSSSKAGDSREISPKKKLNESATKVSSNKRKFKGEKAKKTGEKKEDEEEKERQRKRIEIGEARRREFRPKIVGLQESNCLL